METLLKQILVKLSNHLTKQAQDAEDYAREASNPADIQRFTLMASQNHSMANYIRLVLKPL